MGGGIKKERFGKICMSEYVYIMLLEFIVRYMANKENKVLIFLKLY